MLGRTANGLFWLFRYLERAEDTSRLLDAGLRMALIRDIVTAEEEWKSVIATAGLTESYETRHGTYTGMQAWNFILRDQSNPRSVMAMMDMARTNARAARNAISLELWEAINEGWLEMRELTRKPVVQGAVTDVLATVRRSATQAHGAMDGSMLRNEGYHFARAGMLVERAESTARILDIKYYLLLPSLLYVGSAFDTNQWDTVLRSVAGGRAFRVVNAGQIDARGIVEFLTLDERFPRSLAFCHLALRQELAALDRIHGRDGAASALIKGTAERMAKMTVDTIFETGLHEFLVTFMQDNAAIAEAIPDDYRFVD